MIISVKQFLSGEIKPNQEVTLRGWVKTRRDSKAGLSFINLYDGSCFNSAQIIAENNLSNYKQIINLTAGCSLIVTGIVVESPAAGQAIELKATAIEITGWVENPETYPLAPKRHSLEHLRTYGHLRSRSNLIGAVARIRNTLAQAIHSHFNSLGFIWVSTPIITASDTEGAGELFRVSTLDLNNLPRNEQGKIDFKKDFFGKEAYLTVSGQLNGEAYACSLSKIYNFGPTFRAENSNTTRHLAEFWMVEPEVAFSTLEDNAHLAESLIKACFRAVLDNNRDDLEFFTQHVSDQVLPRLESLVAKPFISVDYTEAIDILLKAKKKFEFPAYWGADLSSEHERYLAEEHFKSIVIVKNYPKDIKAFYMKQNDDGKTVAAMDILAPGIGEIVGGSERETDLNKLATRMKELNLNPEDYSWYLDLRRYGSVPHSGFGLGFERLVCYVTGVENVRDAIAFPRTPGNVAF